MPEQWHGIRVRQAYCVEGGLLSKPAALDTLEVKGGDRKVRVAAVGPQEVWLCEAVANKAVSKRPLGQSTLFATVRGLVRGEIAVEDAAAAVAATDSKMADLDFDSDDAETHQPELKKARVRKPKGSITNVTRIVTVPPMAPAVAEGSEPQASAVAKGSQQPLPEGSAGNAGHTFVAHVAGQNGRKLYIELDALPWLVSRLRAEYAGQLGTEPTSSSDSPERCKVWWDFRDESWVARTAGSRIRVTVRPRMRLGFAFANFSFEEARSRALAEAKAQLDQA